MIITIDGPTASGKSTVARCIAREYKCYYLYSGFLYRALAYGLLYDCAYTEKQFEVVDEVDLKKVRQQIEYYYDVERGAQVLFAGNNITSLLKTPEIDMASSRISSQTEVRKALLEFQRSVAQHHNVVADGRDCGTVVFPCAKYKFFLTASLDVRAQRWQNDQMRAGKNIPLDDCKRYLVDRDSRDIERAHSPLMPAVDALIIDTSDKTLEEVLTILECSIKGEI